MENFITHLLGTLAPSDYAAGTAFRFEIFKVKRNELSGSQLKQWDEFYNK